MHAIAKEVGGISSNNGGKLGESEEINYFFADFKCVRIKKRTALVSELLSNKSQFVGQL